jgi:hypothetical protein
MDQSAGQNTDQEDGQGTGSDTGQEATQGLTTGDESVRRPVLKTGSKTECG